MNTNLDVTRTMFNMIEYAQGRKFPLAGAICGLFSGWGIANVVTSLANSSEQMGYVAALGGLGSLILQLGLERVTQDSIAHTQWSSKKQAFA